MQIYADKLSQHLKQRLAPIYLVAGDEPLLVDECSAAIRETARAAGYSERQIATVEPGFDWDNWFNATQNLSLFSDRRLLDLRIPNAKPGDIGARALLEYAEQLPEDTVLLVTTGKLDKSARSGKWVKALDAAGVLVLVYGIEAAQLPAWIRRRLQARGLTAEAGVAELLAYHMEGNLLALAQEIDKLSLLHGEGTVAVDDIQQDLSDNARFTVFGLVDTCLRGEQAGVVRMLQGLRAEGTEPILVLKVMAREVRIIAGIATGLAAGRTEGQLFQAYKIWPRRQGLIKKALKRSQPLQWLAMMQRAARADRVLKGRLAGDVWQELQCLGLTMSGIENAMLNE